MCVCVGGERKDATMHTRQLQCDGNPGGSGPVAQNGINGRSVRQVLCQNARHPAVHQGPNGGLRALPGRGRAQKPQDGAERHRQRRQLRVLQRRGQNCKYAEQFWLGTWEIHFFFQCLWPREEWSVWIAGRRSFRNVPMRL